MKRAISILMILIMLLSFVGCGEVAESSVQPPASGKGNLSDKNLTEGLNTKKPTAVTQSPSVTDVSSPTATPVVEDFTYLVGNVIEFGSYEQDNITTNGKEKIEWIVLDTVGTKALVISKKCLDYQQYSTTLDKITLRDWLNNEFLNNAFSTEERAKIEYTSDDDKVFCFGERSIKEYFNIDLERRAMATPYAISKGARVNENGFCSWWLWKEKDFTYPTNVNSDGKIEYHINEYNLNCAVRPAIWVKISNNMIVNDNKTDVVVGDFLKFGKYEQDNNLSNGKEDIEWIVLRVDGTKALLLSKLAIVGQPYDTSGLLSWESCSLRKWLNNEFVKTAFSDTEYLKIASTDNSEYGEKELLDKVFILNVSEVIKYLPNSNIRTTVATKYACELYYIDNAWWPLRSAGVLKNEIEYVSEYGSIEFHCINSYPYEAVRPAVWIDISNGGTTDIITKDASEVGSIVKFGTYEQDNNTKNGKEKIEWIVLKKDGNKALVISRYSLDYKFYHSKNEVATWENCDLRKWCNEDFYYNAFSENERKIIHNVSIATEEDFDGVTISSSTKDNVFLLTLSEWKSMKNFTDWDCIATEFAKAQGCRIEENWWCRDSSNRWNNSLKDAVRPAMWITLD